MRHLFLIQISLDDSVQVNIRLGQGILGGLNMRRHTHLRDGFGDLNFDLFRQLMPLFDRPGAGNQ